MPRDAAIVSISGQLPSFPWWNVEIRQLEYAHELAVVSMSVPSNARLWRTQTTAVRIDWGQFPRQVSSFYGLHQLLRA